MSTPVAPTPLDRACAEIFRAWAKHVPADEAQAEAAAFRRRYHNFCAAGGAAIIDDLDLDPAELEATLSIVAECMA